MNNKEYIELTEKKLDQLNASSCKPYTITKYLNGLYNLSYKTRTEHAQKPYK